MMNHALGQGNTTAEARADTSRIGVGLQCGNDLLPEPRRQVCEVGGIEAVNPATVSRHLQEEAGSAAVEVPHDVYRDVPDSPTSAQARRIPLFIIEPGK